MWCLLVLVAVASVLSSSNAHTVPFPKSWNTSLPIEDRIVNGEPALNTPSWMVKLLAVKEEMEIIDIIRPGYIEKRKSKSGIGCGGTLIHPRLVLTAGHCIPETYIRIEVTAGEYDTRQPNNRKKVSVMKSLVNLQDPEDKPGNNKIMYAARDIAVLVIDPPLYGFQPVELPKHKADPIPGEMATLYGWGTTETGATSDYLKTANVPILRKSNQIKNFEKYYKFGSCIVSTDVSKDLAAGGDSGGPVMVNNVQVGVISRGIGGTSLSQPLITNEAAQVSCHLDFINRMIETYGY